MAPGLFDPPSQAGAIAKVELLIVGPLVYWVGCWPSIPASLPFVQAAPTGRLFVEVVQSPLAVVPMAGFLIRF